ncbi:MAG: lipoate--protein ligase family protein [Chlamydiae bacterium]|nr:lipoate--protein ligase family protein [Chlamydiota bacterium]
MEKLYFIHVKNKSIFEQLELEEALLRTDERNICLIGQGSSRAIVMGISGDAEKLIDLEKAGRDQIPIIRRFSGGGTVIVDEDTLFISFLFHKNAVDVPAFPEPLLRWSAELYQRSWKLPGFALQEMDYAIGPQKCGGNAQYIRSGRWLHHTSFLWDYSEENMRYLLLPAKRPKYRLDRDHSEFLCRLKEFAPSQEFLIKQLKRELGRQFSLEELPYQTLSFPPHRKATQLYRR